MTSAHGSLIAVLRQRAEVARVCGFKTDFYALPQPAQDALYGLAALLEDAADALERYEERKPCPVCGGLGVIDGFWLGTVKTCPACHGEALARV